MKGDFSRLRFNPGKNYTSVLQQQGRVALDADANEQAAIYEHLNREETIDVIGEYGTPIHDAGFGITIDQKQNEIIIGAGRYYVEGLMCENLASLSYDNQPFLINHDTTGAALLNELAQFGGQAVIQVFLEVWERLVTALDDPCLREPALGHADTTDRAQTVWRVVAVLRRPATSNTAVGQPAPAPVAPLPVAPVRADCCAQMYLEAGVENVWPPSTGKMSAQTIGANGDCGCEPIPAAGYRGLENQLYRVEIHQSGAESQATLKWSRENGSVVAAIQSISGSTIWVDSLGLDANLGFQANQWVEITDDTYLFGQIPNRPGLLYQIQSIDPAHRSMTMTTPVLSVDTTRNARARRWDQSGASAGSSGVPLAVKTWLTLENGIQVSFNAGSYRSGDYWTIPARTATGQIEWPPCGGDEAAFQSPRSIRVYVAPLACIRWNIQSNSLNGVAVVENCRQSFSPLVDLVTVEREGQFVGTRSTLNFTGAGVTAVTDNPAAKRIDIQIAGGASDESSTTLLLFPYVTNFSVAGTTVPGATIDTGITIANTTVDPSVSGAPVPQSGSCTLTMFPTDGSAPIVFPSASVAAGGTLMLLASEAFPTKQGWVKAVCNFAGAYGFASISSTTTIANTPLTLSAGSYLAIVLPSRAAPPVVTGIDPPDGLAGGGETVTITGSGFTGATTVNFGTAPASNLMVVVPDTRITVISPAGRDGTTVDVTVTTPGGTSATSLADQFTYTS